MKIELDQARQKQISTAVGAGIARIRQQLGLTQEEVAERLNIGNEAISRIERGVNAPTLARLFQFAELFECRVDELLLMASDRDADQAAAIARQIAGLSASDRSLVTSFVDQLTTHLHRKSQDRRPRH